MTQPDMVHWLKRSKRWHPSLLPSIRSILQDCPCSEAPTPLHRSEASATVVPAGYGETLCTDPVYLSGFPFSHCLDRYTTFSVLLPLSSREMPHLVSRLDAAIAEFRRTSFKEFSFSKIKVDQEYERSNVFREWAESRGLEIEGAATEGHEHQGAVESGNRVIRMFYNRFHAVNPHVPVVVKARLAVAAKNACVGAKLATALELWSNKVPEFAALLRLDSEITVPPDIHLAYQAKQRRIHRARQSKSKPPRSPPPTVGSYVRFYRDRDGAWHGPVRVLDVDRSKIFFRYRKSMTSADADKCRVCDPPLPVLLRSDDLDISEAEPEVSIDPAIRRSAFGAELKLTVPLWQQDVAECVGACYGNMP